MRRLLTQRECELSTHEGTSTDAVRDIVSSMLDWWFPASSAEALGEVSEHAIRAMVWPAHPLLAR